MHYKVLRLCKASEVTKKSIYRTFAPFFCKALFPITLHSSRGIDIVHLVVGILEAGDDVGHFCDQPGRQRHMQEKN